MTSDTLRDTFAAAALTGLLCNGDYSMDAIPCHAFSIADAMLRERGNHPETPDSSPVTEPMPKEKRAEVSATLTDAERQMIEWAATHLENCGWSSAALRGLLERLG